MAINAAERNAFVRSLMSALGEDYSTMGRLVYYLRLELPAVDWPTVLATIATNWQPFIDSGLSIDWWVNEVMRQADTFQP
jgi:hypothetical protein